MERDLLSELYRQKASFIYKYLVKIGASPEDAEDIVQNTFFKAVEHMVHLEQMNISSWLFKVAINNYYDLCRKQKRHPSLELEEKHLINEVSKDTPELGLIIKEDNKEINKVLNEMKDSYKNLLLLKYEMDLSYTQIARLLDTNENQIKTYLYRARNDFKKRWEQKNG
ncbi:MAG: sigma-70 family RNA polymerase sigma factor [Cellulosilyticaceae bacterium]